MVGKSGRFAILEQFLADGIDHMFGNPGTVEQGFLDALADFPQMKYILTLQESIAVLTADGYSRATGKVGLVQIHSSPGVGNAIGNLYQAKRGGTPLVVIAGEAGVKYDAMDAQMAADLVAMARPVTKWATRVTDSNSVLRVLRRAIKMALTPPQGPVFVAFPADVLDAVNEEEVVPTVIPDTRVAPADDLVGKAAHILAAATRPMIIMGDGVYTSGAQHELAHLAELIGAEVWGANSSQVNISFRHPLFRGSLGHMFGDYSRQITEKPDVVLITGTYVFPEVFPSLSSPFAPGSQLIHIDLDAYEIGKNFPIDLGLVADPKLTLGLIDTQLEHIMKPAQKTAARHRANEIGTATERERAGARQADTGTWDATPLQPARFMKELADRLPRNAIVFDEALTTSGELTRYWDPTEPGSYFQTRGGSLGVGIPSAVGMQVAYPDRPVVAVVGDGASMYSIQALWTAAHHRVPVKVVVCNNHSYKLLKFNVHQYWQDLHLPEREYPGPFDIRDPDIRYTQVAQGMGVKGTRVETPDQIIPAIEQMLEADGAYLIDLVISSAMPNHFIYHKGGQ